MSSPISSGLHQGLEALRQWTSGESNDSFSHQLLIGTFPRHVSDTAKDRLSSNSVIEPALYKAFSQDSTCDASSAVDYHSDQQRQLSDAQQCNQNAWDVDLSLRELFPGIDDTPALGSYASPTTTSISTPTSSYGCMRPMPTSAPRQNVMSEDYTPEPNEHGYEGADSPYRSYAQLLFTCLYEAHNFERSLKDIYRWMQEKANKGRVGESAGWMNSVRHNLSMNAVSFKHSEAARLLVLISLRPSNEFRTSGRPQKKTAHGDSLPKQSRTASTRRQDTGPKSRKNQPSSCETETRSASPPAPKAVSRVGGQRN